MWFAFKIEIILLPLVLAIVGIVKLGVFIIVRLFKFSLWLLELILKCIFNSTPYMVSGIRWIWIQGKKGLRCCLRRNN